MDECVFKVGQRVWCFMFGWGVVYKITGGDICDTYPVFMEFENEAHRQEFTTQGVWAAIQGRTLFFSEIPIPTEALVPPKPKRELIPVGSVVEARAPEKGGTPFFAIVSEDNDPEGPPLLVLAGGILIFSKPDLEILRIWPPAKAD